MSIKPIDYNVMIPKTQELSSTKHIEHFKNQNIIDSGFIQQEKNINNNKKKVRDTEKSSNAQINENNKFKNRKDPKKKKQSDSNDKLEEEIGPKNIGKKLDIRI